MTTGWDGFARHRRENVWVPSCAVWDPAVRLFRSYIIGMGWARLGYMWDGNGTGSWDSFPQWESIKSRWDGMGRDSCVTGWGRRWNYAVLGNVGFYVRSSFFGLGITRYTFCWRLPDRLFPPTPEQTTASPTYGT